MILSKKQLTVITKGIADITEDHGYLRFHRYLDEAEAYYESTNADFFLKTQATAGVRFDFYTDSQSLSFDYELHRAGSRKFYYFDLFVDGKMISHTGEKENTHRRSSYRAELCPGKKRVTLWFPCMFAALVKNVALDDGALIEEAPTPKTLLAIGDSITHGYDALYPSNAYPALIARHFDINVINNGIGGDIHYAENLGDGIGIRPDYITVALGTNDWCNRLKHRFELTVVQFHQRLAELYPDSKVFVITPLWRGDHTNITKVGSFDYAREYIAGQAKKFHRDVTVLNGMQLIGHEERLFSPDLLHPNDLGFEELAKNLCAELEKHIL